MHTIYIMYILYISCILMYILYTVKTGVYVYTPKGVQRTL